jgi:hypothetical protein
LARWLEVHIVESRKHTSAAGGAFATALEQFEDAVRLRLIRTAPRQRLNHAITLVDSMLGLLESSNLTGTMPAPGSLESGLSALRRVTPVKCEIAVGAVRSRAKLMDELFAVQQSLLAMRAGPAWEWAFADDVRETTDQGALHTG